MHWVLVGIGGVFGGISRFEIGRHIAQKFGSSFPLATLFINISGALLLGLITGIGAQNSAYLLLGDGFLGAFTTFSTFMFEGFHLFKNNRTADAFVYIFGSLLLGVSGYLAGFEIGLLLAAR